MSILQLNNLALTLGGKPILQDINYQVDEHDFIILLGSNGSGKSSLLKLLHQHYQPTSGTITYTVNHRIAVLTQNPSDSLFPTLTVYENYLLAKQQHLLAITHHMTERVFLTNYLIAYNPQLCHKLDLPVNYLSGGEKQALALALCLLQPPTLLLLDEHTSALDPNTSAQIMQLTQTMLTKHHITCILTTHDLAIALNYGNRLLVLREGKIDKSFAEPEKAKLNKQELMKTYY
jgi:putative ABC transport system ATP-binding protein